MAEGKGGPDGGQTRGRHGAATEGGADQDAPTPWYDRAHERFEQWNRAGAEVDARFDGVERGLETDPDRVFEDLRMATEQTTGEAVDHGG